MDCTTWEADCSKYEILAGLKVSGLRLVCLLGLGLRVQGLGFRIQGSGLRLQGLGFAVEGLFLRDAVDARNRTEGAPAWLGTFSNRRSHHLPLVSRE